MKRGPGREAPRADPQLDANVLIGVANGLTEHVAYVQAQQTAGLCYNEATRDEFLAHPSGTPAQLQDLEQRFGITLLQGITRAELEAAAQRLCRAFQGDPLHRTLHEPDARVAATAFLRSERLATGDLRLYKRLLDLGLSVDFIGTGKASAKAAVYQPQPVSVPPP